MGVSGLEGVVAAKSAITLVDGQAGRLVFRGYNIHDLATQSTYEETAYLLWHGTLPDRQQLLELRAEMGAHRELPAGLLAALQTLPLKTSKPMALLRSGVSMLAHFDPESEDHFRESDFHKAVRLTARVPTMVAAFDRLRRGLEVVPPRLDLNQAESFLYMLSGTEPDAYHARVLDIYFVLLADHELNPSTFAARITAATLSDLYSAVTAALGTLKGPLHGGAIEKTMEMLLKLGGPEEAEPYVRAALEHKQRVMGFGHRVYKTEDPRATHLRRLSQEIGKKTGKPVWFETSKRIEGLMLREKDLYPNVDFYSASVMYCCGIPVDLFTPVFACSRMAGWTAHILEQQADNRLIRPRSEYVGPKDLTYVPIERR